MTITLIAKVKKINDITASMGNYLYICSIVKKEITTNPCKKNEDLFNHLEYYMFDFRSFRYDCQRKSK